MSNFKSPYRVVPEKEITPKKSWFAGKEDAICGFSLLILVIVGGIFATNSDNKRLEKILKNRANTCEIQDLNMKFKVTSYNSFGEEKSEAYLDTRIEANNFLSKLEHCNRK